MAIIDLSLNLGQLINGAVQAGVNAGVILLVSHSLQKALIKSNSEREQKEEKDKEKIDRVEQIFTAEDENDFVPKLQAESLRMESNEAKILKQLDGLEMAIQALEYEEEAGKDLTEFFENATMRIENEYLKKLLNEVKSSRPKKS